mmetsp:Transcript_7931/g.12990  ORF Transcript_7931/g.12990 Transcript_7931/m.12990 type:complete len:751 (+) Transcript_7931:34-2286(+)
MFSAISYESIFGAGSDACCGNRDKYDIPALTIKPNPARERASEAESPVSAPIFAGISSNSVEAERSLPSYEDRNEEAIKEDTEIVGSSSDDSDAKEFDERVDNLLNQMVGAKKMFKASTKDNPTPESKALLDELSQNISHLRAKNRAQLQSRSGGSAVTRTNSGLHKPHALTRASSNTFAASVSLEMSQEISSFSMPETPIHQGVDSEEDEESSADEDDEEVIKRRYEKYHGKDLKPNNPRYGVRGIANEVKVLNQMLEAQGLEQSPFIGEPTKHKETEQRAELTLRFSAKDDEFSPMESKSVTFTMKPLGIQWERRAPITVLVVKENSHAQSLGVTPGWQLTHINQVNYKEAKYKDVNRDLMEKVNELPTKTDLQDMQAKKRREKKPQNVRHAAKVRISKLDGFQEKEYDVRHYCLCQIPGKPHSKVRTEPCCVNDSPETIYLEWDQEFELLDFDPGDDIEFCVFKETDGGDHLVGKHLMLHYELAHKVINKDLLLTDPYTHHRLDIKMSVRVRVNLVSDLQYAIDSYRTIMRERLSAIGASEDDIDKTLAMNNQFSSAADVVKAALLSYHKQADTMSKSYPFPGKEQDEDIDDELVTKNKVYMKRLDDTDPTRLWVSARNRQDSDMVNSDKPSRLDSDVHPSGSMGASASQGDVSDDTPKLEIVFVKKGGGTRVVQFQTRPLGIVFSERMPISIYSVKPGSQALAEGVEKGWSIKSIDGISIDSMAFKVANGILDAKLAALPFKDAKD